MSVLASRPDRASENHCVNRSANLRLLEEIAEQFAQSRPGSERYVPATGTRYRAVSLPLRGGEGYGRLRRVPDVRTKAVVTNRGKLTRQGRTTGIFMGRTKGLNSSAAYGDRLDCEQFAFGLFPNGDRRPSSKASHLIADYARPLSCDQKWIDPGEWAFRERSVTELLGAALLNCSAWGGLAYLAGLRRTWAAGRWPGEGW
jgi:hypothetical protein